MSMATRTELVEAVGERYRSADRLSKGRVLDEFAAVTGVHRKHAMRLLRAKHPAQAEGLRRDRRVYDEAVRTALIVLWEAAERLCGKRLRLLVPILLEAIERHGHLDLAPEVRAKLLDMSASTIDRALRGVKASSHAPRRRGVAGTMLRRSVPIRTLTIGTIRRPGISRPTWCRIAARGRWASHTATSVSSRTILRAPMVVPLRAQ